MAMLTIRDLDDSLKQRLRLRAAGNARSMEEEARQILRSALEAASAPAPAADLATRIRQRFAGLGDITLPVAPREPMREPPDFAEPASGARRGAATATAKTKTKTRTATKARRR